MGTTLDGIFSQLESISKKLDNKEGKIESLKNEFDKKVGIQKEEHDKVVSLIEQLEDSEENMAQYDKEITETTNSLKDLDDAISDLRDELSKPLSKKERAKKKGELDDRIRDRERQQKKKDILESNMNSEKRRIENTKKKLTKAGVTDISKAKDATKTMEAGMASAKGGGLAKAFGGMKGNIYMQIADLLVKGIEFGIGKAMEYSQVHYENTMRSMNAVTTISLNQMKAGLDSWQDSVNGAYSAQSLAVESQLAIMDAANATALANMKLANTWTNWIPIWGELNKAQEKTLELEQQLHKIDLENAQKLIQQFGGYVKLTDDYLRKQDHAIHQYQALNGLTVAQTQLFEKRMLANGEAFAKFNKTIEDALKIQNTFTGQSGRAVNYSDSDYTKSFAVGRLVGEDNLTQFQAMMNVFNSSVSSSADIMYDMYNYANKMGLSQQKLTKSVLANLKLANKYDFKNGSKGFMELAKWAENARVSLSSIGSAIEKVQSGGLEGVIKQGAGLQVLGGNIAVGADPIAMMYESFNDPQAYAKRIQGMLRGYGSFNKETGETTFSGGEQMMMRAMSQELNIPIEELKDMARGSRQKEYVKSQMGGTTLSRENQEAIANKAQYDQETKQWYVNTINGGKMDVADVTNETMSQILSNNKEENAEKYAQGTLSAVDEINKTTQIIAAKLGVETFSDFINTTEEANRQTLEAFSGNINTIASGIAEYRKNSLDNQQEMLSKLGSIDRDIVNAFNTVNEYKAETNRQYEEMKRQLATMKENSRVAEAKTSGRWNEVEKAYAERQNTGYFDNFVKGQNMSTARARHYSAKGDEDYAKGNYGGYIINKTSAFGHQTFGRAAQALGNLFGFDASTVDDYVHDGVTSANGQPMAVSAADVVPVHDGTAKLAKTDPQDTAIFAKTGGPFDKLFNDVFGRIDDVYKMIGGNITSNARYSDTFTRYGDIASMIGGNITSNARYGDTIHTIGFAPGKEKSIKEQMMLAKMSSLQGVVYNEMMPMAEPCEVKNITEVRENPNYQRDESGMISPSSFDKPIDVNIHGDIRLRADYGQSIDISKTLESDPFLVRTISQLITKQLSESINGGRGRIVGTQRPY